MSSFQIFGPRNLMDSLYSVILPFRDGNDGPWSSFGMQVGSPPQSLRLLPSTSSNIIWPVLDGGCPSTASPANCADLRATFFNPNISFTWSEIGLYGLSLGAEVALGYAANASYGFDTVTVSRPGDPGMPSLQNQIIAGFVDDSIYMGSLGLYPYSVNFSNFTDPHLSFLGALQNESKIPSTSWAYTAGAYYRQPQALGSLTLGGYDTERFIPNNLSFALAADTTRDLIAGLQRISTRSIDQVDQDTELMGNGIYILLNSFVPDLWLPVEVCRAFEHAFGLTYNQTAEMYFVNDTLHKNLLSRDPNITFTFGLEATGGETIDIVMQYRSFDLLFEDPKTGHQTRYFPLKRAQTAFTYTLGRTFFQDAYIVADYNHFNFSISQTIFPNSTHAQNIVPISPRNNATPSLHRSLNASAIIGIVLGIVMAIGITCISTLIYFRRRGHRTVNGDDDHVLGFQKPELCANEPGKTEMSSEYEKKSAVIELDDCVRAPTELSTHDAVGAEMADGLAQNISVSTALKTLGPDADMLVIMAELEGSTPSPSERGSGRATTG